MKDTEALDAEDNITEKSKLINVATMGTLDETKHSPKYLEDSLKIAPSIISEVSCIYWLSLLSRSTVLAQKTHVNAIP